MVGTLSLKFLQSSLIFFQTEIQTLYSFIYLVQEQAHGYI